MSTYLNNLFNYSRALPKPFEKVTNKVVMVSSMYGDGKQSTLCCTVIKAVNAFCAMLETGEGAIGTKDRLYISEYKSSVKDDYHLTVYNPDSGDFTAAVYNTQTELCAQYVVNARNRDGAACIFAMLPILCQDREFLDAFETYKNQYNMGFSDESLVLNSMAIMCDNAYRRVKSGAVSAKIDRSGNLSRITHANIDAGTFIPDTVFGGKFIVLTEKSEKSESKSPIKHRHEDFVGKYMISKRKLSSEEKKLVPEIEDYYVIPDEIVDICMHIKETTGKPTQMRNFSLRGEAGTGKTEGVKAIAAGLGLPYVSFTCSAETEITDFIGQYVPDTGNAAKKGCSSEKEHGEYTFSKLSQELSLPTIEDIRYDPVTAYEKLSGFENREATVTDCIKYMVGRILANISDCRVKSSDNDSQKYVYKETDFIKALKYGWVVEIQECTTIIKPGVMTGLNNLLQQGGTIRLLTGEVIERHPDAVVILTNNTTYEGCNKMNESVGDRMNLTFDMKLPTQDVMAQRAMAITGAENEEEVLNMVKTVDEMAEYCKTHYITGGAVGMRSLIDWINSSMVTSDPYKSAINTVIAKATDDKDDQEALITAVLCHYFSPGKKN